EYGGKVQKYIRSTVLPWASDECLFWPFSRNESGYGTIKVDRKSGIASRYICELVNGAPPSASYDAAHSCGKGHMGCVNPHHLSWKTRLENVEDMEVHGTRLRGEKATKAKLSEKEVIRIRQLAPQVS